MGKTRSHERLTRRLVAGLLAATAASIGVTAVADAAGAKSKSNAGPIKIGVGTVVIPGTYDAQAMYAPAVKAALAYIQHHGGWGGRRVEAINCTSAGTPAADKTCYDEFANDKVTAVIGILPSQETVGYPMMSKLGIPSFMIGASRADDLSPWEDNISGSAEGGYTAAARYACASGDTRVSVLRDDIPSEQESWGLYAARIMSSCGVTVNMVTVPYGTADLAPYVQKAVQTNPQLLIAGETSSGTSGIDAIAGAGYPASKVLSTGSISAQFLTDSNANGLRFMSGWQYPSRQNKNADIQTYLNAMARYSPGSDPTAQLSVPAFQDIMTIWSVGQALGFNKLTGRSLQRYLNTKAGGTLHIFAGLTAKNVPGNPGVKNPWIQIYRLKGGKITSLGWWKGASPCKSKKLCAQGSGVMS